MNKRTEINVKDESHKPIRWTLRAKRLGAVGLLAAGAAGGAIGANQVHEDNHHHKLVQELEQGRAAVQDELERGAVSPADVVTVPAPHAGYAADVAREIVGPGHNASEVTGILSAQTDGTNRVEQGEEFVLPKGDVPDSAGPSVHN